MITKIEILRENPLKGEQIYLTYKNSAIVWNDPLETWKQCGGYYKCPKDEKGRRIGPLVGYRGTYKTVNGHKRYVGEEYWNFAKVEQYPHVLDYFSLRLCCKLSHRMFSASKTADVLLAAPMGGILFAASLARILRCRIIFAEKKQMEKESLLTLNRHEIRHNDDVFILEDVINNFSTTEKLISLVYAKGGNVRSICCAMNRSSRTLYESKSTPVISVIDIPTAQYTQDDPYVLSDISSKNIVWNPKDEWQTLIHYMEQERGEQCAE